VAPQNATKGGSAATGSTSSKAAAAPKPKPKPKKKKTSDDDDDDDDGYFGGRGRGGSDSGSDFGEESTPKAKKGGKAKSDGRPVEEVYQKVTQLEHILLRPDTYIGSVETNTQPMWVVDGETMVYRSISFVPGLYKIFDEILVNAADNKVRDPSMTTVKVTLDRENNLFSIYNDGRGIPIEIHKEEGVYVPELIFGHLLTSSNYNDNEKKVTGGRNGYGAKLCNIFSTEFTVETADSASGQKYKQVFKNNMTEKSKPSITSSKSDYTKISFKPDLAKFGLEKIDADFEALLKKRVYDMSGCVKDIKVFLNDERIKVKNFKQYCELYLKDRKNPAPLVHEIINDRWEVCATVSETGALSQVSFVNGICTYKGGTHLDYILNQMVRLLTRVSLFSISPHLQHIFPSKKKKKKTMFAGHLTPRGASEEEQVCARETGADQEQHHHLCQLPDRESHVRFPDQGEHDPQGQRLWFQGLGER